MGASRRAHANRGRLRRPRAARQNAGGHDRAHSENVPADAERGKRRHAAIRCPMCRRGAVWRAGSSRTEQQLVEAIRRALRIPEAEDLQTPCAREPGVVARINALHGTGFRAGAIRPDVHLRADRVDQRVMLMDVAIEYDSTLHDGPKHLRRDCAKSHILLSDGETVVIRVRERGLPSLTQRIDPSFRARYTEITACNACQPNYDMDGLAALIMAVLRWWRLLPCSPDPGTQWAPIALA